MVFTLCRLTASLPLGFSFLRSSPVPLFSSHLFEVLSVLAFRPIQESNKVVAFVVPGDTDRCRQDPARMDDAPTAYAYVGSSLVPQ